MSKTGPNPVRLYKRPSPYLEATHKNHNCTSYKDCCMHAAVRDWRDFTCNDCQANSTMAAIDGVMAAEHTDMVWGHNDLSNRVALP